MQLLKSVCLMTLLLTLAPAGMLYSQETSHPLKKGTASSTTPKTVSPSSNPAPQAATPSPSTTKPVDLIALANRLSDKQKSTIQALMLRQRLTMEKLKDAGTNYKDIEAQLKAINSEGQRLEDAFLDNAGIDPKEFGLSLDAETGYVIIVQKPHETPAPAQSK